MDNLRLHSSQIVMKCLEENSVHYIFNVPYSPQFNPIESVFSKVKSFFKRRKLHALANQYAFKQDKEIRDAFRKIKIADV